MLILAYYLPKNLSIRNSSSIHLCTFSPLLTYCAKASNQKHKRKVCFPKAWFACFLKLRADHAYFIWWSREHTIHKKTFCLRQKYPRSMYIPTASVLHAGHKNHNHFEIEATFHTLFSIFHFSSQDLLIIFFVFSNCRKFRQ